MTVDVKCLQSIFDGCWYLLNYLFISFSKIAITVADESQSDDMRDASQQKFGLTASHTDDDIAIDADEGDELRDRVKFVDW